MKVHAGRLKSLRVTKKGIKVKGKFVKGGFITRETYKGKKELRRVLVREGKKIKALTYPKKQNFESLSETRPENREAAFPETACRSRADGARGMSLADKIISDIEGLPVGDGDGSENYELADFQKEWIIGAFAEGINRAALSLGRGGGKSGLLSALAALCLIPGKALYAPNFSCAAFASAFKQGKIIGEGVTGILQFLEIEGAYWITNNQNNFHVIHKKSKATLQCHGSDPRRAHGLKPNLLLGDELAQWPPSTGPRLWSALATSLGKKKGARLLCIGTRPVEETHFFEILLKDKSPDVFSLTYAADPEKDDPFDPASWRKANPGLDRDMPELSIIRSEAERARQDPQELAQFRALRLNMGTSDVALEGFLLDPENWRAIEGTPDCRGSYILGIDLGGSEAFTAAAAVYSRRGVFQLACKPAAGMKASRRKRNAKISRPGITRKCETRGSSFS